MEGLLAFGFKKEPNTIIMLDGGRDFKAFDNVMGRGHILFTHILFTHHFTKNPKPL